MNNTPEEPITARQAQELHGQRRAADPEHDQIGCWCCCWDCSFPYDTIIEHETTTRESKP